MKRPMKLGAIAVAVVLLILLALPALINANQFRPRLETDLSSALGRHVTLGDLSFSLFSGTVRAKDLAILDDSRFASGPFVRAQSLDIGVELWPLILSRKLNVTDLSIQAPELSLIQNQQGDWNFSTLGAGPAKSSSPGMALSVKVITISKGKLNLVRLGETGKPLVLDDLTISVKDFAPGARFPFSFAAKLGKGDLKFDGSAGPISQTDASETPVELSLKISGVDLSDTGITTSSGVSGQLSIDGSASIQGQKLGWKGLVRLDQAKFVPKGTPAKKPVQFDFAVDHDLKAHSGQLTHGAIRLGNAPASLTGTYATTGAVTNVNLHLAGSGMPVGELEAMLPALDIQLPSGSSLQGGTANVDAAISGPATNPVVAGTVSLNSTKLAGFDLGSKVSAIAKLAGIQASRDTEIQTFSASVRNDATGTTVRDLKFIAPALGDVEGAGTISPQQALDFKMRVALRAQGLMKAALGGNTAVPFFVQGTSTNPEFRPDTAGIAAAELNRLNGVKKLGGVDAGNVLNQLFGGKK